MTIVNNAAMNMRAQELVKDSVLNYFRHVPRSGITGSYGKVLSLGYKLFSIMAVSIFIPINRVYLFPHTSQYIFCNSYSNMCEVITLCDFDFFFPDDE